MRNLLLAIYSLVALSTSAQTLPKGVNLKSAIETARSSSDDQLKSYISQAKAQGYSLDELKTLMRAQGASMSDLGRLSNLWSAQGEATAEQTLSLESISTSFGVQPSTDDPPAQTRAARFGADFFSKAKISETPELYLATPSNYQLGPGDQLLVQLYGASEESYAVQISREGTVKINRLPPIYLSGLSIEQARKKLQVELSKIYTGLKAKSSDASKVDFTISLQGARSVAVTLSGNVQAPGVYTLSGFASVISALYAAGGPNQVGSYRNIQIIRSGKTIARIDLYDFFLSGVYPNVYLRDQDVIQVPTLSKEIEVKGGFKTVGFFELKAQETLSDLLLFTGGFLSNAYKQRLFVNRIMEYKRETFTAQTAQASQFELYDGDIVSANLVSEATENVVSIEGAVYIPGLYSLTLVQSVDDLISEARGIMPNGLSTKATLFRLENGLEQTVRSIDLTSDTDRSTQLEDGDRLYIPSIDDLTELSTIEVQGEVNQPGRFAFKSGMRVSDALILADGFSALANYQIILYRSNRSSSGTTTTTTTTIDVSKNLTPVTNTVLEANDLLIVRQIPGFKSIEKVTLEGYVKNKGVYAITSSEYRLYDLLKESGGFLSEAYLPGISVTRRILGSGTNQRALKQAVKNAAELAAADASAEDQKQAEAKNLSELETELIIIGIDGEKLMASGGSDRTQNIVLQEGDIITVPKLDNTVTVLGEVQQKSKLSYRNALTVKGALRGAGGFSDKARKSRVYVVYQNGSIKSRRTALLGLINLDPKLEPGATVVVPEKLPKEGGASLGDIVGVTTSLATLALLIRQIGI